MKKLLAATFVAQLMVGWGEEALNAQTSKNEPGLSIDLDDNETRKKIRARAIDYRRLVTRSRYMDIPNSQKVVVRSLKSDEALKYLRNQQEPYSGWVKASLKVNCYTLWQLKDGKQHGLSISWHENGQKLGESNYKDGKQQGLSNSWHENGQKLGESNYKDGKLDGLMMRWYSNGRKWQEHTYKDGKLLTAVGWKPNGEKCPDTNVVNGNGVVVFWYKKDGTELFSQTFKDGEIVRD